MTQNTEMLKLYSKRILALAADMPHVGRLEAPSGSGTKRSPLCGSVVTVDIRLEAGRIAEYAQDVKACALGQAAASAIGSAVLGLGHEEIRAGRDALHKMLTADGPAPVAPFETLEVLMPAREFRNRHASILLTFDAILAAFQEAQATA